MLIKEYLDFDIGDFDGKTFDEIIDFLNVFADNVNKAKNKLKMEVEYDCEDTYINVYFLRKETKQEEKRRLRKEKETKERIKKRKEEQKLLQEKI